MGHYLKNPDIAPGTLGVKLPIGTNTLSDAPVTGLIRFNSDTSRIEFYYNGTWNSVAKIGTVPIDVDTFTTYDSGGTNQFTMSHSYVTGQENNVLVFVGGVQQKPLTNYTFSSPSASTNIYLTPSTSGDANQTVIVIHNINSTNVPA